ncbi:hypothetical protein NPIL_169711 [Nephila pilipes]|uniref:Uncharacterized protein n=1 Tax=Nephila pilipes TaxID=299642 RepID=A0A8X6MF84_NEPPI|nr:hypothetical protein NPIL_169711 [Nephila pilipes]
MPEKSPVFSQVNGIRSFFATQQRTERLKNPWGAAPDKKKSCPTSRRYADRLTFFLRDVHLTLKNSFFSRIIGVSLTFFIRPVRHRLRGERFFQEGAQENMRVNLGKFKALSETLVSGTRSRLLL